MKIAAFLCLFYVFYIHARRFTVDVVHGGKIGIAVFFVEPLVVGGNIHLFGSLFGCHLLGKLQKRLCVTMSAMLGIGVNKPDPRGEGGGLNVVSFGKSAKGDQFLPLCEQKELGLLACKGFECSLF